MTYDQKLAERVRRVLAIRPDIVEKKMFGGLAFLLDGKMFCGVVNRDLMVRVGPDAHEAALQRRHVRPMDFTGRPMVGFVYVGPSGWRSDDAVAKWASQAMEFVVRLPSTKKRPKRARPHLKRKPRVVHRGRS